jgi:ABC-type antimicrobial peptide transport system permease subunit
VQSPPPTVYLPFTQVPTGSLYFVLKQPGDPRAAGSRLESTIRSMEPTLSLAPTLSLLEQVREAGKARRFAATILAVFAGISALLTGIGLFGLMSHTVRATTQELGVRLALGAWPALLRSLIFRRSARLVGVGTGIGLVVFLLVSNALRGVLYGVAARDPTTLGAVVLTIAGVSLLASWIPAHMASHVDPVSALHAD